MRVAQLDKDNKVVNVILLDSLEEAPRYVDGSSANLGDTYNPETQEFIPPVSPEVTPEENPNG